MSFQTKTFGTNQPQHSIYSGTGKPVYTCANSTITRGLCAPPDTLKECFEKYQSVKTIAENLGFLQMGGPSGDQYLYNLWMGATLPSYDIRYIFEPLDLYFNESNEECKQITRPGSFLGTDWLGCLWGAPDASFSCTCPDMGPKYEAYLKHRLNVATFWNTPKNTPVKRMEFLDALKYGKKANITVAGDFKLKIGQVIELNVNASSGYPYADYTSSFNGLYYITGVKHVITNSGTHETALEISQIPEVKTAETAGSTYAADYP